MAASRVAATLTGLLASLALCAVAAAHQPELVNVPPSMTVEATGPAGAIVTYAAPTATHTPPVAVSCSPANGTLFPFDRTTVVCQARDPDTNDTATGTFAVTVADTRGPVLPTAPELLAEATSAAGARITYRTPTALDAVDGSRPVECRPASGSLFPVGASKLICRATDTRGNVGEGTIGVRVRDTTAPMFEDVPEYINEEIDGPGPVAVTFVKPVAKDLVNGRIRRVTCVPGSGSRFTLGLTTVSCSASDSSGNLAAVSFGVRVVDTTPPPALSALEAKVAKGIALVTWKLPAGKDVKRVELTRTPGRLGARSTVVYRGPSTSFADRTVTPGTRYRYVAVTQDHSGNRGVAVAATLDVQRPSAFAPEDGARVTAPPTLRWPSVAGASYYNVQLFRGTQKILSIWPKSSTLRLGMSWTFADKPQRLDAGRYRWFVWPGFGPLRLARYGPLIGQSSFTLVAPDAGV